MSSHPNEQGRIRNQLALSISLPVQESETATPTHAVCVSPRQALAFLALHLDLFRSQEAAKNLHVEKLFSPFCIRISLDDSSHEKRCDT